MVSIVCAMYTVSIYRVCILHSEGNRDLQYERQGMSLNKYRKGMSFGDFCWKQNQKGAYLDFVSALKVTSWLSFMDVFMRSACAVRAAFFSKAV